MCARRRQVRESDVRSVRECKGVREREKRRGDDGEEGCSRKSRADVPLNNYRTLVLAPCGIIIYIRPRRPIHKYLNRDLNCRFYPLGPLRQMPNALSTQSTESWSFLPSWHFLMLTSCSFFSISTLFLFHLFFSFIFLPATSSAALFSWIYRRRKTMYLECTLWNRFPFIRRFGNSLQMRYLR